MSRFTRFLQAAAPPTLLVLCWGLQQGLLLTVSGVA
jgi:hypothetical protein